MRSSRIARLLGTQRPEAHTPTERPTPLQLQEYGQAVFRTTLARRLHARSRATIIPDPEARQVLDRMALPPGSTMDRDTARDLCATLTADALIVLSPARVTMYEDRTPGALFEITLYLPVRRAFPDGSISSEEMPPERFRVTGTATAGRPLFRSEPDYTPRDLVRMAAERAAARAAHTLHTGRQDPLQNEGVRVALAPALLPEQADKLLFTAEGQQRVPDAVRIPGNVQIPFLPDLSPLQPPQILAPERTMAVLSQNRIALTDLWRPDDTPNEALVRALGPRLHADYLFLTRASTPELNEGPLAPGARTEVEAFVEVTGALVRTADGTVLWQDRARATMKEHTLPASLEVVEQRVMLTALRFAWLDLQRRFHAYRDSFMR
ncbi:MAG: hypothetical protein RMJ43_02700 [Chloroherpetonaceae bacterium]|nr:hypothetical protein [Chthonomonadaceae bacterium]MDW8206720.1 hypothetical protein [Chloroherpetonaceae bacterium]